MAEGFPTFKKRPFERVNLEPSKRDIISVSLNAEERALIDHYRAVWATDSDGTVLKGLAEVGANVLRAHFSEAMLAWLASPKRRRTSQPVTENAPVVTQKSEVKYDNAS